MNKTIHKKLTANSFNHTAPLAAAGSMDQATLMHELDLLLATSKKLLQPRPQAVANILRMAKDL
jgi:hypothetical protein